MLIRLASLTFIAATAGLGVVTTSTPAEAKYPTPWIQCQQHVRNQCQQQYPNQDIEWCVAERQSRCDGLEGDPNLPPPPDTGCDWIIYIDSVPFCYN